MSERPLHVVHPMDQTLFNPLQFQTRALLSLAKSSMWSWLYQRAGISFPDLARQHDQSLVAVEADVEYVRAFGVFDSDEYSVSVVKVRARQGNTVLEMYHEFAGEGGVFARVRMLWRLLELDGDQALTGIPGRFRDSVLQRLTPGEIDPSRERRYVDGFRGRIEQQGEKVAEGRHGFTLYRHQCEVADQWCFLEVPAFASQGREGLIEALEHDPFALRASLCKPLHKVLVKLSCPFYLFEQGEVLSTAYWLQGQLAFVHQIINVTRMNTLAAVVIETFQA
jgi:hypothetical protein